MKDPVLTTALAAFFVVVQLYTSLAALSPTPPVGYLFAGRLGAAVLVAVLVLGALVSLVRLAHRSDSEALVAGRLPRTVARTCACWIGSVLLASLLGIAPLDGLQIAGVMLLGAAFAAALVRFASAARNRAVLAAYLGSGTVFSLAALIMRATHTPQALYTLNLGRAAGFFVTANQFAAYLILLLPIAAATWLATRGPLRILGGLAVVTALPALVLSFSRAGWLGAAAGLALFAFWTGRRRAGGAILVAAAAAGAYVLRRPLALNHDPGESFNRLAVWQGGVRALELFPLTGAGPMAYWRVYPAIRPPDGELPGTFGALHPHNVLLSLGADLGIVGLIAAAAGWIEHVRALRAALRRDPPPSAKILAAGTGAALAGSLFAGMFDTIGVVQMCFVWIPYTGLALALAERGLEG